MSITFLIKNTVSSFSKAEIEIANYTLDNLEKIKFLNSSELAKNIGVSQSTIIKFIKKIGLNKYSDFKIRVTEELTLNKNNENKNYIYSGISNSDDMKVISEKLLQNNQDAIASTLNNINITDLETAIDLISNSRKIILLGVGASSLVCKDLAHKLNKIGKLVFHDLDSHIQLSYISTLTSQDLVIAISQTGLSNEVLVGVTEASRLDAKILSITGSSQNKLAKLADITFLSIANEDIFRSSAISSRMAQLSIIDLLFLGVIKNNYKQSEKAILDSRSLLKELKV